DIYGPSVPKMMGLEGKPTSPDGKRLAPMMAHGLKCMSIGTLVDQDTPMVWRGPMVMSALTQLLTDVDWAPLDILVVDMPPGTGDAQLTLSQRVPLSGAVIVSTPQDIALIDARKGLAMFRKTEVPILGVIENMSHYVCPNCGDVAHIFGHGGAEETAAELGAPYLGAIPLHLDVRIAGDSGTPVFAAQPDGDHAKAFSAIAAKVLENIEAAQQDSPVIEMA
ncbi:MAG: Mrp/NBP35 family ATP-binding protein, partial [Alphaproteobacteria bacterium]